MSKMGQYVRELNWAVNTLQLEQGRIARRNARHRVLNALAAVRKALDAEYPMIKLPRKARKVRTLGQRRKELINDGWVVVLESPSGRDLLSFVAAEKLPIRRTPSGALDRYTYVAGIKKFVSVFAETWVPGWVAHYYATGTRQTVQQARRSPRMIQAAKAAVRLGSLSELFSSHAVMIPKE